MGLPVIVLHCKVDCKKGDGSGVNPQEASAEFGKYDTGLIQVSSVDPSIKYNMGKSIDYVLKAIIRQRGDFSYLQNRYIPLTLVGSNPVGDNRNPASPTIFNKTSPSQSPPQLHQNLSSIPSFDNSLSSDTLSFDSSPSSVNQLGTDRWTGVHEPRPEMAPTLPLDSNGESTKTDVSDGDESHTEDETLSISLPTTNGAIKKAA